MIPLRDANGTMILSPQGRIDLYTAHDLARSVLQTIASGNFRILLDLTMIGSVHPRFSIIIIHCASAVRNLDGCLTIVAPIKDVFTEFERLALTRLGVVMKQTGC